jgi:protein-S-isoprenylcysteine O-methyltransferase Ste14
MTGEELFLRRAVVFGAALVYWAGVLVQVRRVRRSIGRTPNFRPRNLKEKFLWLGWLLVIVSWLAQPLLVGRHGLPALLQINPSLTTPSGLVLGIVMTAAGYAATLWCYVIMGNTWRIGVNPAEKTRLVSQGPYRLVRHPIYLFQIVMLAGAAMLLPTVLSLILLVVHYLCISAKASDEEAYLLTAHGGKYRDYLSRTGRFFPKLFARNPAARRE